FVEDCGHHLGPHSFPTRRSSDLPGSRPGPPAAAVQTSGRTGPCAAFPLSRVLERRASIRASNVFVTRRRWRPGQDGRATTPVRHGGDARVRRGSKIAGKKNPGCRHPGSCCIGLTRSVAQSACTSSACRPFWPCTTLKETFWPSCSDLKPVPWIERKWT